jgi:DHA1 family tetracycline resistance protein-like MFS transporter
LASAAGLAVDYLIMVLAPNLAWLVLGRLIAGVTSASFSTVYAYMADITPPEGRARAYGLIGAAFSAGFVAGPLLGGVLGEISLRAPFWAAGALSLMAFLYGLFILPESLPRSRRMPFSWRRANPLGALKLLRAHGELAGLAVVDFLAHFAFYVFSTVLVLYAAHRYHWVSWQVGTLLGAMGLLDVIVQGFLVGFVTARLGERVTMILGLFAGATGMALMGLAPTGVLFVVALIPNALRALAIPALQSIMTQRVTELQQGQLQGAHMSIVSIAGVVAPLFFGAVYAMSVEHEGGMPGAAFAVAALFLLAAGLFGLYIARKAGVTTPVLGLQP